MRPLLYWSFVAATFLVFLTAHYILTPRLSPHSQFYRLRQEPPFFMAVELVYVLSLLVLLSVAFWPPPFRSRP